MISAIMDMICGGSAPGSSSATGGTGADAESGAVSEALSGAGASVVVIWSVGAAFSLSVCCDEAVELFPLPPAATVVVSFS